MDEALIYLRLGFEHILDVEGYDHMLFLLAMVAPFTYKHFKSLLLLVTAFTLGHCLTLILGGLGLVKLPSSTVELGIAVTILLTALYHLFRPSSKVTITTYALILGFGLIHGLGFSGYIRSLLGKENVVLPLLSFNIGIELGQIVILSVILLIQWVWLGLLNFPLRIWRSILLSLAIVLSMSLVLGRI
jgi:hypothetical protein